MSAEKLIKEMAKVYEEARFLANETLGSMNEGEGKWYAKAFYEAGYRKASDVTLEAVDNFQSRLRNIFCTMCNDNDYNTVCLLEIDSAIECLFDAFVAELKKKYTEGENCG